MPERAFAFGPAEQTPSRSNVVVLDHSAFGSTGLCLNSFFTAPHDWLRIALPVNVRNGSEADASLQVRQGWKADIPATNKFPWMRTRLPSGGRSDRTNCG